MADPVADAFALIGADFEAYMPTVNITVANINPDTGAAMTTVTDVPAMKRVRRRQPFGVGDGGELGEDKSRFVFRRSRVSWTVTTRDQITDGDGIVWSIESVEMIAFNELVAVNVVKKRS